MRPAPRHGSPPSSISALSIARDGPKPRNALVTALLEDPNECVRFAAAKALNSGCCCNKDTIEALRICVSGETARKGNAPETSPRVKAAAFAALQNCLMQRARGPSPGAGQAGPTPERSQTPVVPAPPKPEGQVEHERRRWHPHRHGLYRRSSTGTCHPPIGSHKKRSARRSRKHAALCFKSPAIRASPPSCRPASEAVLDVMAKSRQDAKAATLQHAREQGQVPPLPNTVDPGFAPAAYTPAAAPIQANPLPATTTEPMPLSSVDSARTSRPGTIRPRSRPTTTPVAGSSACFSSPGIARLISDPRHRRSFNRS